MGLLIVLFFIIWKNLVSNWAYNWVNNRVNNWANNWVNNLISNRVNKLIAWLVNYCLQFLSLFMIVVNLLLHFLIENGWNIEDFAWTGNFIFNALSLFEIKPRLADAFISCPVSIRRRAGVNVIWSSLIITCVWRTLIRVIVVVAWWTLIIPWIPWILWILLLYAFSFAVLNKSSNTYASRFLRV